MVCPVPGETDELEKALRIGTFPLAAVLVGYDLSVSDTVCKLTISSTNKDNIPLPKCGGSIAVATGLNVNDLAT